MDRTILHCDLDAFYASVECLENPHLKKYPVAVCGSEESRHGIVLAKSELAKRAGVKTGMVNWEARRLCPGLICVKPHMAKYIAFSKKVREIFAKYTDQIETFGIDEAWLDVTGSTNLFGSGREIAEQIQGEIKSILGLSVSIGVSYNKVFAKLGSDYKKPFGITEFTKGNYKETVWPLPASDLLFVGRATTKKFDSWGIHTIGDIANTSREVMQQRLGKVGVMLWTYANGFDNAPVILQGTATPVKSIGNSSTTPRDLENIEDIKLMLHMLSDTVASRMRAQGLRCRVVEIWVRNTELESFVRQMKMPQATCLTGTIADYAIDLFVMNYRWEKPIRSIGVRVSDFSCVEEIEQLTLFDDETKRLEKERLAVAVDKLRDRYGYETVLHGITMSDDTLPVVSPDAARQRGAGMYELTPQR